MKTPPARWFFTLLVCVTTSFAEDSIPEMATDRPDQTESSSVVPPGFVQLELGWTHTEEKEQGERFETDSFPESLLRVGVRPGLELRFGAPVREWVDEYLPGESKSEDSGWTDMQFGFKKQLWLEEGCLPEAALIFHLTVPTGEEGYSSERVDPDFRFAFSHELNDRWSLGYNLGATWETSEDPRGERDTLSTFNWTAALGYAVTDRLGAYVELFGDVPMSADGKPQTSLDGGFTWAVNDHFQLDILAGVGLSDHAPDWFVGAGVSYRWPR